MDSDLDTKDQESNLIEHYFSINGLDWWLDRAWQSEERCWTIQDWPNDCKLILKAGKLHFYLGSIAAAWHGSQGYRDGIVPFSVPVACVSSMNDDDEERPGEPSRDEWANLFEERRIKNLRYGGYDERFFSDEKPGTWRWASKKAEFKCIWSWNIKASCGNAGPLLWRSEQVHSCADFFADGVDWATKRLVWSIGRTAFTCWKHC